MRPDFHFTFRTARDALRSLEPDSMDDFQVPKKRKPSASGKENKPASNKGRLSLKGKEKARTEDHFSEVTTDEVLAGLLKGYVPPNTEWWIEGVECRYQSGADLCMSSCW